MGAVREMQVTRKIWVGEFDRDEFATDALILHQDTYVRVTEKYREVQDPDGNWWQNRDGDTLDTKAMLEDHSLFRIDVRWADEFADED